MKKILIILLITLSVCVNNTFAQKPKGGTVTSKTEKYTPIIIPNYSWSAVNFENSNFYESPENLLQENTSSSFVCATPTGGVPTLYNFSSHKMTTNLSASLLSVSKVSLKDSKITYFNEQRRWGMKDFASASIGKEIYLIGGRRLQGTVHNAIIKYDAETGFVNSNLMSMNLAVADATAVTLNGKIYVFGGTRSSGVTDKILRFDPNSNIKWTELSVPKLASPTNKPIVLGVDSYAYIIQSDGVYKFDASTSGGETLSSTPLTNLVTTYSLTASTWGSKNWIGITSDGMLHLVEFNPGCDTPPNCPPTAAPTHRYFDGTKWNSNNLTVIKNGTTNFGYNPNVGITCGHNSYGTGFSLGPMMVLAN